MLTLKISLTLRSCWNSYKHIKDTVKVLGHFCLRWLATPLCFSEEDLEISPELLVLFLYCYF